MTQQVLVTGVSGFIAKHLALELLNAGYEVRGTVRALNKTGQIKKTLSEAGADVSRLQFFAADLTKDDGWREAAGGCAGVFHVASPFPVEQPRDRMALAPAARDGALRVLEAAKNAERIIMTSSMVAMMYRAGRPDVMPVTENDWTDPDWKPATPYIVSKTIAEKAAWDAATEGGFKHRLCTVNPGLVFGPALDDDIGASIEVIRLLAKGEFPAAPPVSYPVVDVRDVALLHRKAFETPETGGRRLIAAAETMSLLDIANVMREAAPDLAKKAPRAELPAWLVRIAAMFDRRVAAVVADLGTAPQADTAYVKALTGIDFRTGREAVAAAVRSLDKIKAL